MTDLRIPLLDLLRKYQDDGQLDVLLEGVRLLAQMLMELEVSQQVRAERYERSPQREAYRNGYRKRDWAPGLAPSAFASPSCGKAATSRRW